MHGYSRGRTTRLRRAATMLAAVATFGTGDSLMAQGSGASAPLPDGFFRGTVAARNAKSQGAAEAASGSARWRFELDSMDLRYKLTVRVTLQRPAPMLLVVRTADTLPPPTLLWAGDRHARSLPQGRDHATVSLIVRQSGGQRVYEQLYADTVMLAAPSAMVRGAVLRGRMHLAAFLEDDMTTGDARIVIGDFAATFDPRPDPRPRTISDSLQEEILRRALWDAGLAWQEASVHLHASDSTGSAPLLRGYLQSRWGDAAVIESAVTTYQHVSMRMRGRYAPVTCSFVDGAVSCASGRSWWDRLWSHGTE